MAFAVASSNIGATSQIVVSVDTGSVSLPLTATLCQSNPSTGACLATPASSVTLSDASGGAPTFSVFLQATGSVPFAPATNRVFVRFNDPAGGIHGSTSVAVCMGDVTLTHQAKDAKEAEDLFDAIREKLSLLLPHAIDQKGGIDYSVPKPAVKN